MLPIHTILHPTDFSERSRQAFAVACALARDYGARVIVLHVQPLDVVYVGLIGGIPTDPRVDHENLEARLLEYQAPDLAHPIEHLLREGDPVAEILRVASDVASDLIVMGAHGRTGLSRLLMGSVAEGVLCRAPCPVLTVRVPVAMGASPSGSPECAEPATTEAAAS